MSNSRIILQAVGDQDKYLTVRQNQLYSKISRRHTLFEEDRNIINSNYKNSSNFAPLVLNIIEVENGDLTISTSN